MFKRILLNTAIVLATCAATATASHNVWLDFNGGWAANLNLAAMSAGVPAFDTTEIATMQNDIVAAMHGVYADFDVSFSTTDPTGGRERVDFGAITASSGLLGQANFDYFNNGFSVQSVFAANFDFIFEASDPRADQLEEFSTAIAGTAAHELGHSLGLPHHYAYGDPRITPANYGNTMGYQNDHIMATGPTGLNEVGRETERTLSVWSKLRLESNGLTSTGVIKPMESVVGEIGGTTATAFPLTMQQYVSANVQAGLFQGIMDSETDRDFFEVTVNADSLLTAEIWTGGGFFDATLSLFDSSGGQVAFADEVTFDDDTFDQGGTSGGSAPYMLNIPVQPGTYFLEVGAVGPVIQFLDRYDLTVGVLPQLSADFNADGFFDCNDIDALVAEIAGGGNSAMFDLTGDGVVDLADRDQWLVDAGAENLLSGNPYLPGDANLDGAVDVADFNIWNANKFTATAAWCSGDFNADGNSDVGDFNIWNNHKFQIADQAIVPEPDAMVAALFALAVMMPSIRRRFA